MADWDAVRYFLELARAKTLARAARRLRVDYTTVGRRVSALERELGAKLFERTPDGFVLTDAGEGIRAAAEQMEQSALAAERESGDLRVRRLTPIGFALYASEDYLARHRPPAPGAGFAGHDAVLFEEGFRGSPAYTSLTHPLRDARAAVRANSMLSLIEAVAIGLGVGALPCCLGDADPRLRRVFPDLPLARDDLWLVVHADVQRTGRIRALIAALEARCREAAAVLRG
jgi:DNA-binding transcriptional LysR family regulator